MRLPTRITLGLQSHQLSLDVMEAVDPPLHWEEMPHVGRPSHYDCIFDNLLELDHVASMLASGEPAHHHVESRALAEE